MNMTQINFTLIAIVGALGLNLLTGYTGLISIGNAAFFAFGAMVAASIGGQVGWPTCRSPSSCCSPAAAARSSARSSACPSLRIRGIYLLLGTLSLHFIIVYLFLKFQAQ